MTVNADRRQPRYDATRADAERAKAIADQRRPPRCRVAAP
jgi:hypothetical protein